MLEQLKRKIQLIIGRCVINTVKNDKYQIELLAGETRDEIELVQQFGYKSVPPKNTKGITVSVGGVRDNTVIIATENSKTIELKEGETAVFNDHDSIIEFLEGGIIKINGDGKNFVTHAELNTSLQSMLSKINAHTHTVLLNPLAAPPPPPAVPLAVPVPATLTPATLDISSSKTEKVFTS